MYPTMRTQGEIEAAISEGIGRFEQDYMGRGPKDIHAHLLGDFLVVRLPGVLTAAEQHLVKQLPAEKGRDLLKQVRTHLVETARPLLEAMVQEATGVKVVTMHHDFSTITGERDDEIAFAWEPVPAMHVVGQVVIAGRRTLTLLRCYRLQERGTRKTGSRQ